MLGNLNIKTGESTYSQSSKFNSQSLGGSVGNNGFSANIGMGQGESTLDQTTFTNSQLAANNGTLKVNTAQDTNIIGANLAAKDIDLTIGGNLLVKSKQNLLESDAYNIGLNIGISGGKSGPGGSIGGNIGDSFQSRAWTDQLTSIIGTNSVTINTTKNTDIVGALIANKNSDGSDLGNLTLNTGSLTHEDLKNYNNSESNNFSASVQFGGKPNNPTAPDKINLVVSMNGNESSSDTKATIGNGSINIGGTAATADQTSGLNRDIASVEQNKRDVLTSDFDAKLTVPVLLLTNPVQFGKDVKKGYDEAKKDLKAVGKGLKTTREFAEDKLGITGTVLTTPTSAIEGTIFTFLEEKNTEEGSRLRLVNLKTGEVEFTNDAAARQFYALNGISNTPQDIVDSYFANKDGTRPTTLVERENPTHGAFGDLIESGLGKMADWVGLENTIAMNRIAKEDNYDRRNLTGAVNLYLSQGTIIEKGSMQAYSDD